MAEETPQNSAPWRWGKAKHEAAQLLAEDELTDAEVARKVAVDRKTLWLWKKRPEFAARVAELAEQLGDLAGRRAVGRRGRRLSLLDDEVARLRQVLKDRAADPSLQEVPGGPTGLVVREVTGLGAGENFRVVEEYRVDTATLRELREALKQAAQECGQWTEKVAPTSPDGSKEYSGGLTDEQRVTRILAVFDRATTPGQDPFPPAGTVEGA